MKSQKERKEEDKKLKEFLRARRGCGRPPEVIRDLNSALVIVSDRTVRLENRVINMEREFADIIKLLRIHDEYIELTKIQNEKNNKKKNKGQ